MGKINWTFGLGLLASVVLFIVLINYLNVADKMRTTSPSSWHPMGEKEKRDLILKRNELSKLLNQLKQDYGKLHCQSLIGQSKDGDWELVSKFGGWCKQASRSVNGSHAFDAKCAEVLSDFFRTKRVASFGDGPGDYKKYIDKTGRVIVYDAYDGAPYSPENSNGAVKFLDLTAPQYGLPSYDWIVSLEVAEHIPAQFESVYVDNMARHAREGLVLSWAVPDQGGLSHVNNRPLEYVKKILSEKGFRHDSKSTELIQNQCSLEWLRANTNVYVRNDASLFKEDDL